MSATLVSFGIYDSVSLAKAKEHLRISNADTSEDLYIETILDAAHRYCELYLGFNIAQHTYESNTVVDTSTAIQLPAKATLLSVLAADGTTDVLHTVSSTVNGPKVTPAQNWQEGDTVRYLEHVPVLSTNIVAAILLVLGDLYEERADSLETGYTSTAAHRLLNLSRVRTGL